MLNAVPKGARPAARVILIDDNDRVLYLRAQERSTGKEFWVMPGGGLHQAETFEEAAMREVQEETGLHIDLGPCVWTRHHIYTWEGREHNQYELFFVAFTSSTSIMPPKQDDYIAGHRWWTLKQLQESNEHFAPTAIATLLEPLLKGSYPTKPFNCGV